MFNKKRLNSFLLNLEFKTRRSLGQNFLYKKKSFIKILFCIKILSRISKIFIEIGSGLGNLSNLICKKNILLYLIEMDNNLFKIMKIFFFSKNIKSYIAMLILKNLIFIPFQ